MAREYQQNIRRVAIIGAGVSGLMAARYIQEECGQRLETLRVFERNRHIGGTWVYSEETGPRPDIPSKPMSLEEATRETPAESPIYANLRTNLPHRLMALYNRPYPSSLPDYPSFPEVLKYWQTYADDYKLHQYISLNTHVNLVERTADNKAWRVILEKRDGDNVEPLQWEEEFDAVVMSNGHHQAPYTPAIPGLAQLSEKWSERVLHSSEYRHPESYEHLSVMVVGNGPSAVDIANDLRSHAKRLSRCIRNTPLTDKLRKIIGVTLVPNIARIHVGVTPSTMADENTDEFKLERQQELAKPIEQQVWLEFDDGHTIPAPDRVLFATGYRYAFPFLPWLYECEANKDWPPVLAKDASYCMNLYRQIYYTAAPTLLFPGLQKKTSILVVMERQIWHLACVLSGQCGLPSQAAMEQAWEEEFALSKQNGINVNVLNNNREWEYMDELIDDVIHDPRYNDDPKKERPGKVPEWWKEGRKNLQIERQTKLGFT
ncbi:hypothetical protein BDF22DRAFT_744601 [Syncephalis plumigaleata]|nr:hypothetical protein BDF22DRAFT_744601 [Syncephalis plumigaleata]